MIGIIARYGSRTAVAVGPTRGYCQEIILALFAEDGLDLSGVELPMIVFDPMIPGGILIDRADESDDMSGWSLDGYSPPKS